MLSDWLQTGLATTAFTLLFLAPGYLVATLTDVMRFQTRSFAEKVLWSIGLSGALSTAISCILGRLLPSSAILGLFLAIGIAAAILASLDFLRSRRHATLGFGPEFRWVCLAMALLAVYCTVASNSIQTHTHLYEGVASTDLSIRIPLVEAGARGGVPPGNPLFALNTWRSLRSHHRPTRTGRWVVAITAVCIAIGLGGQLWQITMDRLYLPLISHNLVESKIQYQTGAPFLQARRANDAIAANLPADAIVQSDPGSRYQSVFLLYLNRQTAAGDEGCEAAFGGNFDLCQADVSKPLHALFGGDIKPRELDPGELPPDPPNAANMTTAHFLDICSQLHLNALIATSVDVAWNTPNSWVWSEPTLYADDAVRVINCPR